MGRDAEQRPDVRTGQQQGAQSAPQVAPGKVTRTSSLPGHAVQRQAAPGAAAAPDPARSLTDDPWMDAAHRGSTAFQAPVQAKAAASTGQASAGQAGAGQAGAGPEQNVSMDAVPPNERERLEAVLARGGQPLPASVAQQMSARFGTDLSSTIIHTDSEAGAVAAQLGALAFTWGQHVIFAPGFYQPGTPEGLALLAHELTHIVQTGGREASLTTTQVEAGSAGSAAEGEADAVARSVLDSERGGGAVQMSRAGAPTHAEIASASTALGQDRGGRFEIREQADPARAHRSIPGCTPQQQQNPHVHSHTITETNRSGNRYSQTLTVNTQANTATVSLGVNWVREGTFASDTAYRQFVQFVRDSMNQYFNNRFKIVCTPQGGGTPFDVPLDFRLDDDTSGYRIRLVGGQHGTSSMGTAGGVVYQNGLPTETQQIPQTVAHELGHAMLGANDEYADPSDPGRPVFNDDSLMGNYYNNPGAAQLKIRHVDHIVPEVARYYPGHTCRMAYR